MCILAAYWGVVTVFSRCVLVTVYSSYILSVLRLFILAVY